MSARNRPAHRLAPVLAAFAIACAGGDIGDGDSDDAPDAGSGAATQPDADPGLPPAGDPDAAPAAGDPDAAPPAGMLSPKQQDLFDAINAERAAAGVAAVALRADLTCAAQAHSDDIGTAMTCAVVGTGGETIEDRVEACSGPSVAAALVGCGYLSGTATATGWADDAGTRAILLDPALKFVGVGEHDRYWTAVFDR